MAWSSEITQYVGWNYVGDSLEMETFLAILGMPGKTLGDIGADEDRILLASGSSLSSPRWDPKVTGLIIKEGHPFFITFVDSNFSPYRYDGYMYNSMPIFGGVDVGIFKSKCGDWVYSLKNAEPYLYLSSSMRAFAPEVYDGMDLREISAGLVNPNGCFKCDGTTPEDHLDQYDDLSYTFKDYAVVSTDIELASYNYCWTKGADEILHHEEPTTQYKQLSTYLGLYHRAGYPKPTVFGTGFWSSLDGEADMHGYGNGLLLRCGAPSIGFLQAILKRQHVTWGSWEIADVLEATGLFEDPQLLSSSSHIDFGSDARVDLHTSKLSAGVAYSLSLEWDGIGIGDYRGDLRFAQLPWWRQKEPEED